MIYVFDNINSKFFVLWHKTFWTFDGQFSQFCPNTLLRVHSNGLRMGFFEIYFVFYIISNFELNCSDFAHQNSRSLSTLLSNSLQEIFDDNFLMTIFFTRNDQSFLRFRRLTKISSDFPQLPFGRVAKTAFYVASGRLEGMQLFSEKNYFLQFYTIWITNFPKCLWMVSGENIKTCLNLSRGLWRAISFQKVLVLQFLSDFQRKLFRLFRKIVVAKTAIYLSRWNYFWTCSL